MSPVHVGCAAGFAGDRFDASGPVIEHLAGLEGARYLVFEVLAERTLALAQQRSRSDPTLGYSDYLDAYLRPALAGALAHGICIISNLGAANPIAAAHRVLALAQALSLRPPKIAVVTGDNLLDHATVEQISKAETLEGLNLRTEDLFAANAYLGARPIAEALALQPDLVLVGRTTDSALVLGPLIYEFGWRADQWDALAAGTICGHLLECGSQVSGGYFADPGFKDVQGLDDTGYPVATVTADGAVRLTKPAGTGGVLSVPTVTEQLLYELHDPSAYVVPDVVCDITNIELQPMGENAVSVLGVKGRPGPEHYKATVCQHAGWLGEAELSYAGPNALRRAELALEICNKRLARKPFSAPFQLEILGTNALFSPSRAIANTPLGLEGEYRIRAAILSPQRADAQAVVDEILSLYCSGPAGGGGYRNQLRPQVDTASILVPRDQVEPNIQIVEVGG